MRGVDHEPEEDFTEFYRACVNACLRAVYASVGDRALAEDLTAEAFARAYASWRKISRHPAPTAWVVRTALNTEENTRSAFVYENVDASIITIDPAKMPPGSAVVLQSLQFTTSATGPGYSGVAASGGFALLSAEPTGCTY